MINSASRTATTILSSLFILVLLGGSLATLLNLGAVRSEAEKRTLAAMPRLTLDRKGASSFPTEFEQYFNDRFGFREQLVFLNNLVRVNILGTSPVEKVVVGENGWLFYAGERAMATDPLTPGLLELWCAALEAKRAWLKAQGIDYVFMVVPDKHSVYPELLPRGYRRHRPPANLDLLVDYLNRTSTFRVLDVRAQLVAAKASAPVYYRTDTHWNRFGAAVANEGLLRRLAEHDPSIVPVAALSHLPKVSPIKARDMASNLMMQNLMTDAEVEPGVPLQYAKVVVDREQMSNDLLLSIGANKNTRLPKAVVFHDSFFDNMKPYFAEHFSRVVMVGGSKIHKFELEVIARERPQVVVEEIVERYLKGAPYVPKQISNWYKENRERKVNPQLVRK